MTEERNMEALRQLEESLKSALPPLPSPPARQNGNGSVTTNVVELPADRAKAVEYGLTQFQQVGHERDELRKENIRLRDEIAALKIENEGLHSQLTEALSQARSAMLTKDEAVARRAEVETVLGAMLALGRAFSIRNEPLITNADDREPR